MQGNTSDIVRLWQSRIACQGPASAQVYTTNALGSKGSGQMVGNPEQRSSTADFLIFAMWLIFLPAMKLLLVSHLPLRERD